MSWAKAILTDRWNSFDIPVRAQRTIGHPITWVLEGHFRLRWVAGPIYDYGDGPGRVSRATWDQLWNQGRKYLKPGDRL